jgi:hypothetical protein
MSTIRSLLHRLSFPAFLATEEANRLVAFAWEIPELPDDPLIASLLQEGHRARWRRENPRRRLAVAWLRFLLPR